MSFGPYFFRKTQDKSYKTVITWKHTQAWSLELERVQSLDLAHDDGGFCWAIVYILGLQACMQVALPIVFSWKHIWSRQPCLFARRLLDDRILCLPMVVCFRSHPFWDTLGHLQNATSLVCSESRQNEWMWDACCMQHSPQDVFVYNCFIQAYSFIFFSWAAIMSLPILEQLLLAYILPKTHITIPSVCVYTDYLLRRRIKQDVWPDSLWYYTHGRWPKFVD